SQHAPEFDKKGRAEITEMAHGIIFSSEHTAKTAFDMALHNIRHRIKVRKTIQLNLNPSSEPDVEAPPPKNHTAPTQSTADKGKGRATDTDKLNSNKKRKKSSSAKKRKGKKKARVEESSEAEPSSPSSSSSSSSGHSSGSEEDSTSDSDTDSSEDDDDKKWIPEKHNPQLWGALNIPDRIAKKVDKGEYVDLWWFTPDSLNTEHDAKATRKLELMDGELHVSAPTKPAAFTKDEHLSWDDFLYAVDKWTETMKMEEIGKKTRAAWDKFNYQIRKHKKRNEPCVKQALQMLHQFQRKCFAHDTRQNKNKKKRIKKNTSLSDKEREERLRDLKQFNPALWPKKNFRRIMKNLKEKRQSNLEKEVKDLRSGSSRTASSSHTSSASNVAGPSSQRRFVTHLETVWRKHSQQTPPSRPSSSATRTGSSSSATAVSESARGTTPRTASGPLAGTSTAAPSAARRTAQRSAASMLQALHLQRARRLDPEGWNRQLNKHGLSARYPKLVLALKEGLDIGITPPTRTYIAKHHLSATSKPEEVTKIINKELLMGRYAGPYTIDELRDIVGDNVQTSPLGLRPKANGKFRPIQDFSHAPRHHNTEIPSINSQLDSDAWPTTWSSFDDMCRLLLMHPRTAQAFVRDVTSAFRQVPLHPSQWPGTVVEWEGKYYIDLFLAFGLGPACGAYGLFADAYADISRAEGIASTGHWVDDNVFLRVKTEDLPRLNLKRKMLHKQMRDQPERKGGRLFWRAADGSEHIENYGQPIKVQPGAEDGFHCGLTDIDRVSEELGWPWEPEKDEPWSSIFKYAGIVYNIATREVSLPQSKREKYLDTIAETKEEAATHKGRHQLPTIQRLHGQCQWARKIYTNGRFHLGGMQAFIREASKHESLKYQWRHGGKPLVDDITWWENTLRQQDNHWRRFDPAVPVDLDCYC
ncbi:hypothetical protein A4X13_0g8772, partial [Tilletia indica]